ncbi:MAG: M20/M25/M40 family metallo-hydrolase [Robiginitomaculum sp.]|nr:M20/M25/M40 family metallo-hydrolase [Robiginitomaculum sp.]
MTTSIMALMLAGCDAKDAGKNSEVVLKPAVTTGVSANPEIKILADLALNGSYGYDITRSLTTEIGPRLAGTPQEAKARRWARNKFKELGFTRIRTEPFPVKGWLRGLETAHITKPYPQRLVVTALGGSVATPKAGTKAPVAYFADYEALLAAPMGSLDGKIAYISGRMEKHRDGAGYGPANQKRRSGATEAAKRGAVAVLIRSVGTDSHRFPHTGQMRYAEDVKKIPIGALSSPDADQLDRIFAMDKDVEIKLRLNTRDLGEKISGNVMAEIRGTEKPDEIILIGAHLDSWDMGTGAVDDGAGVGIVMGAAQVLMESGLKPKRTIRVVLFGAEEVGLVGAWAYAEAHKDELAQHVLATESDFGAGKIYGIQAGKMPANKAGIAAMSAEFKYLGILPKDGDTNGGPDIIPLDAAGVPTVRLNQDGTDYFDLHHTPDDTFDKIDPKAMQQNVAAYATLIWLASESDSNFRDEK